MYEHMRQNYLTKIKYPYSTLVWYKQSLVQAEYHVHDT